MAKKTAKGLDINASFQNLLSTVNNMGPDVEKFAGGNKAAGVRVRKGALDAKNIAAQIRKEVSSIKAGM